MPAWILESPYSPSTQRILGSCRDYTTHKEDTMILHCYHYPHNYELWHLTNEDGEIVGALLLQHDDYVTFSKMVHVPKEYRQMGWSKKLYNLADQKFGPLVYSEDRTSDGNKYLPQ